MISTNEPRCHRTPQVLRFAAYRETVQRLLARLRERGHGDIRPKHAALFANIDLGGTRATERAARAGMGKAAMGELVTELERLGYVERRPDPADQRAKLVVPLRPTRDLLLLVHEVNADVERDMRRRLGPDGYAALRSALVVLAPDAPPQPRVPPSALRRRPG